MLYKEILATNNLIGCELYVSYTLKVLLQEVRVGGVGDRAVRSRVAWVTQTVGAAHTSPMTVTHVLTLWANVHVVQRPCWRSRTSREETLIPTEPYRSVFQRKKK